MVYVKEDKDDDASCYFYGRTMTLRIRGLTNVFMESVSFSTPETTVLFNATAESEGNPHKIKEIMARQLISPVKWYDIILKMLEDGVNIYVEVGPKKVLTGLLRKIIPREREANLYNVQDMESLRHFLEVGT